MTLTNFFKKRDFELTLFEFAFLNLHPKTKRKNLN